MFKKKNRKNTHGFTLVELIVVLVILGILIALLIPALTGYIKKANNKEAMAQCRQAVVSTQSTANELFGDSEFSYDEMNKRKADIIKLAEVNGTIDDWAFDGSATTTYLVYTSKKNITVEYKDKKFTISDTKALLGSAQGLTTLSNRLSNTKDMKTDSIDQTRNNASKVLQNHLKNENNGKYPKINESERALLKKYDFTSDTSTADIVWMPLYDSTGQIFLAADFKGKTGVGQAQAGLIYYQGEYYVHRNGSNRYDTATISDQGAVIDVSEGSRWEKASLD